MKCLENENVLGLENIYHGSTSESKFYFNLKLELVKGIVKIDKKNMSKKSCTLLKKIGDKNPRRKEKICKYKGLVEGAWNMCDVTCGTCNNY